MTNKTQTTKIRPAEELVHKIKDHISACPNMENTVIIFHSEAYALIEEALDAAHGRGYEAGVEHERKQ